MKNKKTNFTSKQSQHYFGLSKKNAKKLGMQELKIEKYATIKEVLETTDGMVAGQCTKSCAIRFRSEPTNLKDGSVYIMPKGHFDRGKKEKIFKPYRKPFKDMFRRYRGEDLTNKRLLMSRTGGLGDIVVLGSVAKAIKHFYPTCKITFATSKEFIPILKCFDFGLVDQAISIPFEKKFLDENDYHMTFIHGVENCLETTNLNFYESFQRMTYLDYNAFDFVTKLNPSENIRKQLSTLLPKNLIIIHLKSTTKLRSIHMAIWSNIIKKLVEKNYNVGIIDSPDRASDIDGYIQSLRLPPFRILNLARISKDVFTSVSICSMAIGAITIDSAIGHIMGALQIPTVTFCGPHPAYNIIGAYKYSGSVPVPEGWNECGKMSPACFLNSQEHQCPFVVGNQFPGCFYHINEENTLNKLEELIEFKNKEQTNE